MNNTQAVMAVAKQRKAALLGELDTIDKFIALIQPKAKKSHAKVASNGAGVSSARSEAMRRAWAKRKKAGVAKKAKKATVGASLADVA